MPQQDRKRLEKALRAAHKAGDTQAAQKLAGALRDYREPPQSEPIGQQQATEQQQEPLSMIERFKQQKTPMQMMQEGESAKREFTGKMASNVPGSAMEFGKNIAMPLLHPIDTAESVYNLGAGVVQKAIPGEQGKEQYADAMGRFIADRYGSIDNFKKTAKTDPVGLLADISMIVTAGGSAAARVPGKVGQFGRTMQKVGKASEPINLAKGVAKTAVSKVVPKSVPVGMYESSAKFSTTFPKAKRKAMAETALEHKIMPTANGLDKLSGLVDNFDTQITGLIDDATKAGKTVPKGAIYKHLNELRRKVGGTKVGADKNLRQINKAAKAMDIQLKKIKKDRLTPNELQDIKTSAYADVSYEAKRLRSQTGTEAATKAIARGAKEAIEGIADVKDLNRELGKLLKLKDPLSRSAARIENRNIVSIDAPIKIGAGTAAGGSTGAAAGTGLSILEHPKVKAKLAIKLKQIQDAGELNMIDHNLLPTLIHYGLLQAGRTAQLPSGNYEREYPIKNQK